MHLDDLTSTAVQPLARAASGGGSGMVAAWSVAVADHPADNLTTAALARVSGTFTDGSAWSLFAKELRPVWESAAWELIPVEHRPMVEEELDWLDEPRVYRSGLGEQLPDGLRFPTIHRIDRDDRRITIWMEDVADQPTWDVGRYHHTASLLGRLGARWPEPRAVAELGMDRRPLDRLFFGKITHLDLVVQADDRFWQDPDIASSVDERHRTDLFDLAGIAPRLLAHLERLPHGMAHGDAAPSNFRLPGDGATVAIDWSYGSVAPLGSDLGQLVAGRFESGVAEPGDLAEVAAAAVDGYVAGLRAEGDRTPRSQVEEGFAATLAIRTLFSLLLVEPRPERSEEEHRRLLRRRAALGRWGFDLTRRVLSTA